MKTQKHFFKISTFLMVLFPFLLSASKNNPKGDISGIIKEQSTGIAMEYANVALYSVTDSLLITGTITGEGGAFTISDISFGEYYLELNFIGFKKKQITGVVLNQKERHKKLGEIYLLPASELLNDVQVVAEKSQISYQIDKKVINVGKDLSSTGGTAVNVLENAPSVKVDAEGNVQMRGSSDFTVLINGKPSLLKGSDALKQLPASGIEKVEIITNPSAKYDPDGKTGILNVIMKKESLDGINALLNISTGTGDKYLGNGTINYRKRKINLFAGLDYSDDIYTNDFSYRRDNYNNNLLCERSVSESLKKFFYSSIIYKGGFDLYFNDQNNMTISGSIGKRNTDKSNAAQYISYNVEQNLNSFGKTHKYEEVFGDVCDLFGNFTHKFDEGHDIVISGQYESWDGYDSEDLEEQITDDSFSSIYGYGEKHKYKKDNFSSQFRFKIDYQKEISDHSSIAIGYQLRNHQRDEIFRYDDYLNGEYVINTERSNELDYTRKIHSLYTTYKNSAYGFQYQIGMRVESTRRNINISNESNKYTYKQFDYFPSIHISRELPSKQQMQLSYSRRVRRPDSWILNNIPRWLDANNIFLGDPMLEPEYADSYELSYRKSFTTFSVNTQLYYRNTSNAFSTMHYMGDIENQIMYYKQTNADNAKAMGLEASANITLSKWWQLSIGGNVYNYDIEGEAGGKSINNKNLTWDSHFSSTFKLKHKTRIQLNAFYDARTVSLSGELEPLFATNISASKEIGPLTVAVSVRDVFNSMKFDFKTKTESERSSYISDQESPIVMINLSYKFNNYRYKKRSVDRDNDYKGGGF